MSLTGLHAFDRAVQTANAWLADVERTSGGQDREHAWRLLRAWLRTLRDRLPVDATAKFGAQLPLLLRGVYYEGWHPGGTPVRYNRAGYVGRFAAEAAIPEADVPGAAQAVTEALMRHLPHGEFDEVLAVLPLEVRGLLVR